MVLVPLVIVGTVTFRNSYNTLEEISKQQSAHIAQGLAGMVRITLTKELAIVSALAGDPVIVKGVSRGRYKDIDVKLSDIFKKIGTDYEGLAVLDRDGNVRSEALDKRRIGIKLRERDYFRSARAGKANIGTPVESKASGQPIIGICAPILGGNGEFIGAALAVVKIDFLIDQISSIKVGETGYPFVVDARGIVIAHPNREFILKTNMNKEEGLEEISREMLRQQTGAEEYTFRGKKKVAGFAPIAMTGWSVGVTQDKDEIMALAYSNRNFVLIISGVFLGITILAVFSFSRSISTPIQKTLSTLNKAVEQAAEAFVIIGLDRKVRYVNPAMARIVDQQPQELIDREPFLDNERQVAKEEIWSTVEGGNIWAGCLRGKRKNGANFVMETTITPVRDEMGGLSCFLEIGRDITSELRMEAQMRQGQKMEAIGTLAGGIAHDFNNILGAIFGYTELTILSLDNRVRSIGFLEEILKAAGRARDLINQIMTFSRSSEQEHRPIVPKYIIKEALKLLRASLPATIEIREEIRSDSSVVGDPTQMHQIIMNLCANAGHSMRGKDGILSITLDDVDLDENFSRLHGDIKPGRYLCLSVADSGCGISPEIKERIFDPFFTTKPQGEGTGLGLSLVHGIVKNLNGTITVYSEIGKGSVFTVYMPVIRTEADYGDGPDWEELQGGSERLLLVDDEDMLVEVGKVMLENMGYKVQGFSSSLSAWEAFCRDPDGFDAVITDYTMPHLTGYELAKRLREIRKDIPIIMCSGYMDGSIEEKAKDASITELIKKPFTGRDMARVLRKTLSEAKG
ncbi:MAG: cache domain-containing protein [Syntrophales bacterium]